MTILPPSGSRIFYLSLLAIIGGVIVVLVSPVLPLGGPFGNRDAKRDLAAGRLVMMYPFWDTGFYAERGQKFRETLRDSYGVEVVRRTPSCFAGGFQYSYDRSYNRLMRAEIIRRFGRDVVQEEAMRILRGRSS